MSDPVLTDHGAWAIGLASSSLNPPRLVYEIPTACAQEQEVEQMLMEESDPELHELASEQRFSGKELPVLLDHMLAALVRDDRIGR